jgi:hypothetical protein
MPKLRRANRLALAHAESVAWAKRSEPTILVWSGMVGTARRAPLPTLRILLGVRRDDVE